MEGKWHIFEMLWITKASLYCLVVDYMYSRVEEMYLIGLNNNLWKILVQKGKKSHFSVQFNQIDTFDPSSLGGRRVYFQK